jgi:hypothetical protein
LINYYKDNKKIKWKTKYKGGFCQFTQKILED